MGWTRAVASPLAGLSVLSYLGGPSQRWSVWASLTLSPIVVVVSSNIVRPGGRRAELDPPSVSVSEQVLRVHGYVPLASSALILYILLTDLGLDILA